MMKEIQADDFEPPAPNQQIVRILGSRGNNLHEVESNEPLPNNRNNDDEGEAEAETETSSDRYLVSMPTKFRKNVWVKRGDFVIVEPINEGDKVKAEIVRILTPQHIKEFTKDGIWPDKFASKKSNEAKNNDADKPQNEDGGDDDENDDELFKNTNRAHQYVEPDDDETDEESSEDGSDKV